MDTLRTAFDTLRKGTGLDTLSPTSMAGPRRTRLCRHASSTAQKGTYQIEVVSLARAAKLGEPPVADPAVPLGEAGDFTLNGIPVSVAATDTLNDVRDKINATNTGLTPSKVSASILTVGPARAGSSSPAPSRAPWVSSMPTPSGACSPPRAHRRRRDLVTGADAQIKVDGIPITRATNEITDVISGVTLSLQNEEPGTTVTLDVDRDAKAALDSAKAFVDAYNATVKFLKDQQTPARSRRRCTATAPAHQPAALSRGIVGVIVGDAGVPTTGSIAGFSISKTGELSLDESKFSAAYTGDFDNLRGLFTDGSGSATLDTMLTGLLQTNTGALDVKNTSLDTQIFRLQDRIDRIEARLEQRRAALLSRFAQMEATIGALQTTSSFIASQSSAFSSSSTSANR